MTVVARVLFALFAVSLMTTVPAPASAAPLGTLVASYTATPPASIGAATTTQIDVLVKNTGDETWPGAGVNAVNLSYHWYTTSGVLVVWDGTRTPIGADIAPGGTRTIKATVDAPTAAGTYVLRFALVKEGVAWFPEGPAHSVSVPKAYTYAFGAVTLPPMAMGERYTVSVPITNAGSAVWNAAGPKPVVLAYHWQDASGRIVVWDGTRTPLATDLAPGQTRTFAMTIDAPPATSGTHHLTIDVVREGVAWFEYLPNSPLRLSTNISRTSFNAGYGVTTTPTQMLIGGSTPIAVQIDNYGPRTLSAGGTAPVRLSYHIRTPGGAIVIWDGTRGILPRDVPAGTSATVTVDVIAPTTAGSYVLEWDLVQEGVAWFSSLGIATKREPVTVAPGVTFYGKGWGHGVGMSQWGAQGWAIGAAGPALTGEQIIAKYFPGTTLMNGDPNRPNIRVLLSSPSSTGIFTCGMGTLDSSNSYVSSAGNWAVLDAARQPVMTAPANQLRRIVALNGQIEIYDATKTPNVIIWRGAGPIVVVAGTHPINVQEKRATYDGEIHFANIFGKLSVVNYVSYERYTKAVLPKEVLSGWHHEAYKAQAYAARTYAYASYRPDRHWDVHDDQRDQCYGGVGVERPEMSAAVDATAGKYVTYNGAAIRTYFSSSSGGYTVPFGCWGGAVRRVGSTWECTPSPPYYPAIPDPADLAVSRWSTTPWTYTFTGSQIRDAVICAGGPDIGVLRSIDLSNRVPADVGHAISVRVFGTAANADVQADRFLRDCLGMRSTNARLAPF